MEDCSLLYWDFKDLNEWLKANENRDYIGERAEENNSLFKFSKIIDSEQNSRIQNNLNQKINQNMNENQAVFTGRKR